MKHDITGNPKRIVMIIITRLCGFYISFTIVYLSMLNIRTDYNSVGTGNIFSKHKQMSMLFRV